MRPGIVVHVQLLPGIQRLLHTMASMLEPIMILAVGVVVGFIVMAVLLPVFEMSLIAH